MGFDAFAINRIDYRLKDQFKKDKELEFIWRTSSSLNNVIMMVKVKETDIFVHILSNHYGPPETMDFGFHIDTSTDDSMWPNMQGNPEIET